MVIVLLEYIDLFLRLAVLQVRIFSILKIIIPIMLALCLMLSGTYYAKNYAGIIGRGLILVPPPLLVDDKGTCDHILWTVSSQNGWFQVQVHVCMYVCMYVCTYVCMYVCM